MVTTFLTKIVNRAFSSWLTTNSGVLSPDSITSHKLPNFVLSCRILYWFQLQNLLLFSFDKQNRQFFQIQNFQPDERSALNLFLETTSCFGILHLHNHIVVKTLMCKCFLPWCQAVTLVIRPKVGFKHTKLSSPR